MRKYFECIGDFDSAYDTPEKQAKLIIELADQQVDMLK